MCLYQFLVAIRNEGGDAFTNDKGEETMHLNGIYYRTIRFVENGLKPVYVFDGKAPEMKSNEVILERYIAEYNAFFTKKSLKKGRFQKLMLRQNSPMPKKLATRRT